MIQAAQVTAAGWLFIALGHTRMAKDWQPALNGLPNLTRTCATAGWYEGSGFFVLTALLNYAWAQNPELLRQPVSKAMAGLLVAIPWVAGWYYAKRGVGSVAMPLVAVGALQAYSAFSV